VSLLRGPIGKENDESAETPILDLVDVHANYGSIEVLHGVNISVKRGEVVALLGPNGAGKSTTLKIASGLMRPTRGSVRILGHDCHRGSRQ